MCEGSELSSLFVPYQLNLRAQSNMACGTKSQGVIVDFKQIKSEMGLHRMSWSSLAIAWSLIPPLVSSSWFDVSWEMAEGLHPCNLKSIMEDIPSNLYSNYGRYHASTYYISPHNQHWLNPSYSDGCTHFNPFDLWSLIFIKKTTWFVCLLYMYVLQWISYLGSNITVHKVVIE